MGTRWPLYQANAVVKGGVRTRLRVEKGEKTRWGWAEGEGEDCGSGFDPKG